MDLAKFFQPAPVPGCAYPKCDVERQLNQTYASDADQYGVYILHDTQTTQLCVNSNQGTSRPNVPYTKPEKFRITCHVGKSN